MKQNNRGFTLIEMLVASAIGIILILGASIILLQFTKAQWYSNYTSEEWSNIQLASSILPRYLELALDVDWEAGSIGNIGAGRGRIRLFNSGFNPSNVPQPPITVGAYLREAGNPSPANTKSDIRATGIFLRNPSITTPGELIISSSGQGFGSATISSNNPLHILSSIVEMQLSPSGFPSVDGDPVRSVRLQIVFRRFLEPDKSAWHYCPESEIANWTGCQTKTRYVDETLVLDIPLVNNAIPTDFGTNESLYGNMYFFNMSGGSN